MPDSPDSNSGRATADGSGAVLSVSLFGGCSFKLGEREIVVQNRKAKALIGYLAFAPNHRETRGRLAGLLWRDMDEERARGNLRHVLQTLRDGFEAAGYSGFTTDRTEVGLEAGGVRFDVLDATGSIDRDWPDDVLLDRSRVADCVLDGFEGVDPGYDSWLLVQRESLRQRWLRHLQDRFNGVPDATPNARRLAQALLQLDTTHEPACRCVMRHSADRGDGAAAITVYDRLSVRLDEFHGMPPSDETQALVEEIKRGTYRPRTIADTAATVRALTAPRAAATASEPSAVAERLVLIVNRFVAGGGEEGLVFAFRHELITRLSRFREWSIVDGEPMDLTIAAGTPCYTLSVTWGILVASRTLPAPAKPEFDYHRFLSSLGLVAIATHVTALLLDGYANVTPRMLVGLDTRPSLIAGSIAMWLCVALPLSFRLRKAKWISQRVWRGFHWLGYVVWALALGHGIASGSDTGSAFAMAAYAGAAGVVLLAILYRVGARRSRRPAAFPAMR